MTETTFDEVYSEVKKVSKRLDSLERAVKELMVMVMPECEISEEEWGELKSIEAEMDRGESIPLDDLKKKYGAP
jgi:uncharacterized coiled-coil DUF342 family protein